MLVAVWSSKLNCRFLGGSPEISPRDDKTSIRPENYQISQKIHQGITTTSYSNKLPADRSNHSFARPNTAQHNMAEAPTNAGVRLPPTPEQLQSAFDHGIWYALSLWPALHVAVQNSWGGADSSEKRDWFAGAVSDLFTGRQDTDAEDLEAFLLQIMQDEFDCNVEDETEVEVVRTILVLRKTLLEGDVSAYETLEKRWNSRGMMKADVLVVDNGDGEVDEDDEDDEMDDEEDRAPRAGQQAPREPKEKPQAQVDDDGFTKVVGKKR